MNSAQAHNEASHNLESDGGTNGTATTHHSATTGHGNGIAHKNYDHGSNNESNRLPAFGGSFQPGSYSPSPRKFANPAPLGLSAFALTTFVLSLINMRARNVMAPNIVVASAFAYGGLVQLLAGMWYVLSSTSNEFVGSS